MDFEQLYNKSHRYLYAWFKFRITDTSTIDDLLQDVYLRFYRKYQSESAFTEDHLRLLFGFCRNVYKEHVSKAVQEKNVEYNDELDYSAFAFQPEDDANSVINEEKRSQVVEAMKTLNPKVRAVLEYRFFYGMSRSEVAAVLSMKERDVLKYQQRGIKYLKEGILHS